MVKKIAIIGAGSWGTALSQVFATNEYLVSLWAREKDVCDEINLRHRNSLFMPGVELSERIRASCDIKEVLKGQKLILLVVPSQYVRNILMQASSYIEKGTIIVSAVKGIETASLMRPTEIIKDVLGDAVTVAVLSGPSFAKEVIMGMPTAVTIACENIQTARELQHALACNTLRLYAADDMIGTELGGSLKNVIAIAAGICDGANIGRSARAALITRGLAEIMRLGVKMGAKKETFSGLAGMGDLILTATDEQSRNRTVGFRIGKGENIKDILNSMIMVAEGVQTSIAVKRLSERLNVEMPVSEEVYEILHIGKDARASIKSLLSRPLKDEHYGY
ncbi:MAG: NAD(P)H-dependent glycerol-3-phosphate dehydrogenase [bacterium]